MAENTSRLDIAKTLASFTLAAALVYFAYALITVAKEVQQTRKELPQLLDKVQTLESGINIEDWLALAQHIDTQIPAILEEIAQVRATVADVNTNIPKILNEVKAVRTQTVPPLLAEVKAVRVQTVPPILAEIKAVRTQTVPPVLAEVKAVRTQTVPPVLAEVAAVRKMTPETLTRVEKLMDNAEKVANKASQAAVEGSVMGILKTPWNIVEGAGKAVIKNGEKLTNKEE